MLPASILPNSSHEPPNINSFNDLEIQNNKYPNINRPILRSDKNLKKRFSFALVGGILISTPYSAISETKINTDSIPTLVSINPVISREVRGFESKSTKYLIVKTVENSVIDYSDEIIDDTHIQFRPLNKKIIKPVKKSKINFSNSYISNREIY